MKMSVRPLQARIFALLFILCSLFMGFLGLSAAGYFVPAICLLLQAALLWLGRGRALFTWLMLINLASGLVLILALWLGEGLGDLKLDISGIALLTNLATGGPLMGVFAVPLLALLTFGTSLPAWFWARHA